MPKLNLTFKERLSVLWSGTIPERLSPEITTRPAPRSHVIGTFNGFTLTLWQRSDAHIKFAQELFKQEKFRDLLAVLSNARPMVRTDGIDPTRASLELGRVHGFNDLLRVLLALPFFPDPSLPEVEADYSPENEESSGYIDKPES